MTYPITVRLPAKFAEDHEQRECLTGNVIRRGNRTWLVEIPNAETLEDWLSDSSVYSESDGFDFEGKSAVCRSAKRCHEILSVYR